MTTFSHMARRGCAILLLGGILGAAAAQGAISRAIVETVVSAGAPDRIEIRLSQKAAFRVMQLGRHEMLIAMQHVDVSKEAIALTGANLVVKTIRQKKLPGDVVGFTVITRLPIRGIDTRWDDRAAMLRVTLLSRPDKKRVRPAVPKTPPGGKRKETTSDAASGPLLELFQDTHVFATPPEAKRPLSLSQAGGYAGNIDDFWVDIGKDKSCSDPNLKQMVALCRPGSWPMAVEQLDRYVAAGSQSPCMEQAYFIRAFAHWRLSQQLEKHGDVASADRFQEAMSYFPNSRYVAYALAASGQIYSDIHNDAEAAGYFKILLNSHNSYPGLPEVMMAMGRIDQNTGQSQDAIDWFQKLIKAYPDSAYAQRARVALGQALFDNNRFADALKMVGDVASGDPGEVFASPDILLIMGNSYYQMGDARKARHYLSEAYNLFPAMPGANIVLTRIGDTYRDEKQPGKAMKFYRLVVSKYPGTDGFVISAMRLAEMTDDVAEKEKTYRMIVEQHGNHPMAKLALFRLAALEQKAGKSEKSIATIDTLWQKFPGQLRAESMYILQDAYVSLFDRKLKEGDYPSVLKRYESNRQRFSQFQDPRVFYAIGRAYLAGHLYKQAVPMLQRAQQAFPSDQRPADLMYLTGLALDESGQRQEAMKTLQDYVRQTPKGVDVGNALWRLGLLLMVQKQPEAAIKRFQQAWPLIQNDNDRSALVMDIARGNLASGHFAEAVRRASDAMGIYAAAPEKHIQSIFQAYRLQGDAYRQQGLYLKAGDAYAMALKFAGKQGNDSLRFLVGESYEKGADTKRAKEMYHQIQAGGDTFWGRLAQERIRGIDLAQKFKQG
jgi:tetratricopeptide (TPR) repeat protein